MRAVNGVVSFVITLVVLFFLIHLEQTVWVGSLGVVALLAFYGYRPLPLSIGWKAALNYVGAIVALALDVFLFVHFGWPAGVGFIVLIFVFGAVTVPESKQKSVADKNR